MSSRRVGAPKAAAGAVRYKPSLVNTNMRGPVKIAKPDAEDHGSGSMSWWKETVGQLSPILRYEKKKERLLTLFLLPTITNDVVSTPNPTH